jgi:hypothetical protein
MAERIRLSEERAQTLENRQFAVAPVIARAAVAPCTLSHAGSLGTGYIRSEPAASCAVTRPSRGHVRLARAASRQSARRSREARKAGNVLGSPAQLDGLESETATPCGHRGDGAGRAGQHADIGEADPPKQSYAIHAG